MKKLEAILNEKKLSEISVKSKAGQNILEKQKELEEVIDQWSEEMSEKGRKLSVEATKNIEKVLAPLYKEIEDNYKAFGTHG